MKGRALILSYLLYWVSRGRRGKIGRVWIIIHSEVTNYKQRLTNHKTSEPVKFPANIEQKKLG